MIGVRHRGALILICVLPLCFFTLLCGRCVSNPLFRSSSGRAEHIHLVRTARLINTLQRSCKSNDRCYYPDSVCPLPSSVCYMNHADHDSKAIFTRFSLFSMAFSRHHPKWPDSTASISRTFMSTPAA